MFSLYVYIIICQYTLRYITADESARDHVIARLFVYVYGEDKVIWSQTKV